MKQLTSIELLVILLLTYTAYEIFVIKGTWLAANQYQGLKLWAVLAKIAVSLGAIMLVSVWVSIIDHLIKN